MQAQHPGLTLTGMYNVLEKLRGLSVAAAGSRRRASADNASSSAGDDCQSPLPKAAALQEILESLAALGRARVDGERFSV